MKLYKDGTGKVYAYKLDGSQDGFIKPGLTPITETEADVLRFPQSLITEQLNAAADREIAKMLPDAVIALVEWAEKQASGADKTTLKTMLDNFNAEKAKKK